MKFVITGVSGRTGSAAAEVLLARGHAVKVVLRSEEKAAEWKARGAEVAIAELGDAPSLARAMRDADGAYLLVPPNAAAPDQRAHQTQIGRSLAAATIESGVPHVVLLSGFAAHKGQGSGPLAGLHDAERWLGAIPNLRLSSIRAGYFFENIVPLLPAVGAGVLPSFFPAELAVPMVATQDIGRLTAELLEKHEPGIVEQGSMLSYAQVAEVLSKLVGKPVRVDEVPPIALPTALANVGFSPDLARLYVEMITGSRDGSLVFEGGHPRIEAVTSLETFFAPLVHKR